MGFQRIRHTVDLGIAMQLTNICRDIAADAALNRRYLPAGLVGDLAPGALIHPTELLRGTVRQCVATLLDCADTYYQSGELGLSYLPARARSSILVAARMYHVQRVRQRDIADLLGVSQASVTSSPPFCASGCWACRPSSMRPRPSILNWRNERVLPGVR